MLSVSGGSLVYREPDGVVRIQPSGNFAGFVSNIEFPDTQGLILEPTLVWDLMTDTAGERPVRLTYQTTGLTWRADYSVIINSDDTAVDVGSWVTVVNQSGVTFDNAKLKLVAGDVQRVTPQQNDYRPADDANGESAVQDAEGFEEKSFFEYHLYTLGRPTSLPDNSTKQIELFDAAEAVPAEKVFVYYGLGDQFRGFRYGSDAYTDRNLGNQSNNKVDVYLTFKNAEDDGLGVPLPAGKLRVYKQDDADNTLEFVGEDVIDHTAREETVLVKLGSAFDVVGERKQTDYQLDERGRTITESFEIKLRNRKEDQAVKVLVKENLFRWATWEIVDHSDDFEKIDARTVHFPVTVAPDEEKVVTYTVKYTW